MLTVLRAVAGCVEGAEARGVLAEFVAPESGVVLVLRNPVCVHVLEEIVAAKRLEESANIRSGVGWDESAILQTVCGVW